MNSQDLTPKEAKALVSQQINDSHTAAEKMGDKINPRMMRDLEALWLQLNFLEYTSKEATADFAQAVAPHRPTPQAYDTAMVWQAPSFTFVTTTTL